jgi:hypothetical protein
LVWNLFFFSFDFTFSTDNITAHYNQWDKSCFRLRQRFLILTWLVWLDPTCTNFCFNSLSPWFLE